MATTPTHDNELTEVNLALMTPLPDSIEYKDEDKIDYNHNIFIKDERNKTLKHSLIMDPDSSTLQQLSSIQSIQPIPKQGMLLYIKLSLSLSHHLQHKF